MLIGCVVGPHFSDALRQINRANSSCDGVELRLDLLVVSDDQLQRLRTHIKGVLLVTDLKNGMPQSQLGSDYITITADYLGDIPNTSAQIIRAYHNFTNTPEDLEAIYQAIPPADQIKIACQANSTTDALRLLNFAKGKQNLTAIAMGELGQISRVLGPVIGNTFDFVAIEGEAAPGQLSLDDLLNVYNYRRHSSTTKIYGLIGNPIAQSPSHKTHNHTFAKEKYDAVYLRMLIQEEEIPLFIALAKQLPIAGLSVTIPYKEKLFEQIDVLEGDAKEIGAINTLTFENGIIFGKNTDASGALDAIEHHTFVCGKQCVILGAGGSAKAIAYEAHRRGAHITVLSRRKEAAQALAIPFSAPFGTLDELPKYDILINTTPNPTPIKSNQVQPNTTVMDISVAHAKSPLMEEARSRGCQLIYGLDMFHRQAAQQFTRWFSPLTTNA